MRSTATASGSGEFADGSKGLVGLPVRRLAHIASWIAAAITAAYIAWSWQSPPGYVAAILLPLAVVRFPLTGILLTLVVAQEIDAEGDRAFLTTMGHDIFLGHGKLPIILPLAVVAALAGVARSWPPLAGSRSRLAEKILLGSAAGMILLSTASGLINGQSAFSALNQNARPFILLALGLVIGISAKRLAEARFVPLAIGGVLTLLLLAAMVSIRLGDGADDRVSRYFVYYDTALPAIAAAILIAVLVGPRWRWDWQHGILAAGLPILVLVSMRRSVWIAGTAALAVALVLAWSRWRGTLVRTTFAGLILTITVFGAPGLAEDLNLIKETKFIFSGPAATRPAATKSPAPPRPTTGPSGSPSAPSSPTAPTQSPAQDKQPPGASSAQHRAASTEGHLQDLRLGWRYVQQDPWGGVGPVAPQLPGMAAKDATRVYVHNQLLQDWLRYGLLGPLLTFIFLLVAGLLGLDALRRPENGVVVRSAAVFCLIAPLCLMTAPFLSETSRWPPLIGIAAGILIAHRSRRHREPFKAESTRSTDAAVVP